MVQTRFFCLTIYEFELHFSDAITHLPNVCYAVAQKERGDETHRIHWQAYVVFNNVVRLQTAINRFHRVWPTCHVEQRMGNHNEAKAYCEKEETRLTADDEEFGTGAGPFYSGDDSGLAECAGERSDLKRCAEMISSGKSDVELCEEIPKVMLMYSKGIAALRQVLSQPAHKNVMRPNLDVTWIYGESGSGKTHHAWNLAGLDAYNLPPFHARIWFDRYCGQTVLFMDNLTTLEKSNWTLLMQILDKYPLTAEVKGGTVIALWEKVIVTSIAHPRDLLPVDRMGHITVQEKELQRRVTHLVQMIDRVPMNLDWTLDS